MNIFQTYKDKIVTVLDDMKKAGELPVDLDFARVTVEPPRDASHGDMSTNAAMVLAKPAGMNPRQLGEKLAVKIAALDGVGAAAIAGPGFVNFRLNADVWAGVLHAVLTAGTAFGDSKMGGGQKVNIEYVSVNPTGPMHAGHMRGAVIGDTLASLLQKAGYDVTREYYFNDAGTQIDVLARTTYLRYREALGEDIGEIPEGLYPGEYLKDVGAALAQRDGDKWLGKDESAWLEPFRVFATERMMARIKSDLDMIGIKHDVFTNERDIINDGTLELCFNKLNDMGLIYQGTLPPPKGKEMEDWEPVELTLFRSSNFGDSTDRPLKKRDGTWAYIMPDIAYHYNKIQRGFTWMINFLGKDHGGYTERMRPAVEAFSEGRAKLDVVYNGMVKLLKNGEPVKLSKRAGNIVTLRDIVGEVGPDVVRFHMMTRTPESEMEFDFVKVQEQSKDNPVFYVQYAHARCSSVLRNGAQMFADAKLDADSLAAADLTRVTTPAEVKLIRMMASFPRVVESAAEAHEAHRIAFYLHDLASEFHTFWNLGRDDTTMRFLHENDPALSLARLALVKSVATVIAAGLAVMGVKPLEEMHG